MKDWLSGLRDKMLFVEDKVPKGFYSTLEIMRKLGLKKRASMKRLLVKIRNSDEYATIYLRRRNRIGRITRIPYYGPKMK